uniref:VWFD domain-containing protein n=1 Tax=Ditylenchus dipsaci TaxID=166011 RepID=A0A915DVG3_9BILA
MFQPDNKSPVTSIHPKLEAFYTSVTTNNQQRNGQVQSTDEESSSEERRKRDYAISQKRNYKHSLKCVVETKGTARTNKAEFKVDGTCDARLRACEANVQAKRSALAGERIEWTMKRSTNSSATSKLTGETPPKRRISASMCWESLLSEFFVPSSSSNSSNQDAFCGPIPDSCQYRLKPANEHYFANKLECVKANNFWNTESRLVKAEGNLLTTYQSGLHQGQVEGLFSIEPETGRHANVSIQTPSQKVKITGLNLPIKMRPMKLVRPHSSYAASHSASQLNRAECKVGVKTVDTFDKVALRAPISKCYTVLAKDCGDETESKFAILMRSLQTGGEQKKLKIITPSKEIVLEDQVEGRMRIRVDDEQFNMEEPTARKTINTDSQGRLLAFVDVDGADVAVKFNGKTAKIQMSEQFKEKQCGLCGNYNDNQDDELRNNENKLSSDVKAFHRSYTLDRDGGECQEDERTNFYERQPADFGHTQPKQEPVDRTVIMEYNHKLCFSIKPVKQCPQGYFGGEEEEGAKQLLKRPKVSFSCLDRQSIEGQRLRKIVRRTGVADLGEYQPSFYETVVIPETCIQY